MKITKEDIVINNLSDANNDLLKEKGLGNKENPNDKYLTLYKNYKILIEKYLNSVLNLKEYDYLIDNCGLKFTPVNNEEKDYYQLSSTMGLKYLYLRNNLYIEKLSQQDIEKITKLTKEQLLNPSNEILSIIEDTYKDIINESNDDKIDIMVCYGVDEDNYWFESTELVFGIRCDEYLDNGIDQDSVDWVINFTNQNMYINKLIVELNKKATELLGIKTNFIRYNEFTVNQQHLAR